MAAKWSSESSSQTEHWEHMTFWFTGSFEKHVVLAWLKIKSEFSVNKKQIPTQIYFESNKTFWDFFQLKLCLNEVQKYYI